MARNLEPKCKKCRRAGSKLFLKGERCNTPKCAMVKRNYPPGVHGPKGKGRLTDFGMQLSEKQKIKRQYCLMEKQFRLTFTKAGKQAGDVGENFISLLETRIDNAVYRAGFASSRAQARQMINHGLFTLNGGGVNIPSMQVKTGDEIKIKQNKKSKKIFKDINEKLKNSESPGWMNVETKEDLAVKILHKPDVREVMQGFNIQMVVEYYSK